MPRPMPVSKYEALRDMLKVTMHWYAFQMLTIRFSFSSFDESSYKPSKPFQCSRSLASAAVTWAVVENASGDDSLRVLRDAVQRHRWEEWVEVISEPVNGGFAAGNNVAIRPALASDDPPRYVWLLNPDTRVVPETLPRLLQVFDDVPDCGVVGPRIVHPGEPQSLIHI